jgi:hypothetical protein
MLTVYCPPGETSTWVTHGTINGNSKEIQYAPRLHTNGRMVIDIPRVFFSSVILSSNRGKLWEDENYEAMVWLGRNDHAMEVNDCFPGADRPPPSAAVVNEVAPVMMRMRAPTGVTSYSHGGAEYEIGKDGVVMVEDHVAAVLRSHGFLPT